MSRKNCRINFADVKKNVWKNLKQMVNFKIIWQILPKGQIISEVNCGVLNLQKKTEIILRISALAKKMGQIKKNKVTLLYQK